MVNKKLSQAIGIDASGFAFLFALPLVIAVILILIGASYIAGSSVGIGLILSGIGVLIGGFGSTSLIGYFGMRIIGPAGIVMIVLGVIIYQLAGR
jgi:hypothetical protein